MLNLKIIVGSTRPHRAADLALPWLVDRARNFGPFDVDVLDLRDWPLPMFTEAMQTIGNPHDPKYSQPLVTDWNATIGRADAFLFLTPEYNHSLPAVLKNAIDSVFLSFGFRNKPAAAVAYSMSGAGGVRAVEHLAHILIEAEAVPLRNAVLIPKVTQAFTASGAPVDDMLDRALTVALQDLEWWSTLLRDGRTRGVLAPAMMRPAAKTEAVA